MRKQSFIAMVVGICLLAGTPLTAKQNVQRAPSPGVKTISLQWEDLAPLVAGREVEIVLSDGTKVRGDVYAVQEDRLVMDVKKTSNKRVYPKGQQSIERASIPSLNLRNKTIRWRVIATTAGIVVGAFAAILTYCATDSEALSWAVWTGVPIGLHVAARPADVQVTRIDIAPSRTADFQAPEEN